MSVREGWKVDGADVPLDSIGVGVSCTGCHTGFAPLDTPSDLI